MKEIIYTRLAEQADADYIMNTHAAADAQAGMIPDVSPHAHEVIEKRIANPDHRRYIVAMAGSAIVGAALLVETPLPPVNKRGQYIDMMNISAGERSKEIEDRLLIHAAQIAIMNAPGQLAENSFLRIDQLTRTRNVEVNNLRLRGADLAYAAKGQI